MTQYNFTLDDECTKQFLQDKGGNYFYGYRLLSRHRDSCLLTNFNFEHALAMLEDIGDSGYSVLRERHWGHGWIETIMIHEHACEQIIEAALDILASLAQYPILSEDRYSTVVHEAMCDLWEGMALRDRIALCASAEESIFMARRQGISQLSSVVYDKLILLAEE